MTATRSIARGFGLATGSAGILFVLWLANLIVAMPAAVAMRAELHEAIGPGIAHKGLEKGFDADWYSEFSAQAQGLAKTFTPTVIGAAAIFDNLEAWWTGRLFAQWPGIVALGIFFLIVWAFLLGGAIEGLVRPERRMTPEAFLGACGRSFPHFLLLAMLSGALYYGIYRFARWLFPRLEAATRDVTSERTILLYVLAGATLVVLLLSLVRTIFDFAKIAVVAEQRGALAAFARGLGFVFGHPGKVAGVYIGVGLVWLAVVAFYARFAPGAGQATFATILLAFLAGQLYLVARIFLRLALLGAGVALFQSSRRRRFTLAT